MAGRAFDSGRPFMTDNLARTDAGLGRGGAATRLGLKAGLAIPVVGEDGPLAVLSYYSFHKHEVTDRLVTTLTGIGSELGRFLERRRADLGPRPISPRELDVLLLAAEGNSGPQIAAQLSLSPATVKTHFENIYDKLGVGDRAAAVARAMRIGLIR
jgi:DNA-binding CsgD family transcriptional regulator